MTDEEIFDLAERHGWMDDFGRWNFKETGLIKFALALLKAEWVGLTHEEVNSWELPDCPTVFEFAQFIEAKLKEKNT